MKEENTETFGSALIRSIASENLSGLTVEFSEIALDSILEEGLAKNIPFYQVYKAVTAIRDLALLKKIYAFLFEHKNIGFEERVKFLSKFETEQDLREFGETVILLLDRVIHVKKAQIIGRLSRAYGLDLIDRNTFLLLSECVDRLFLQDIPLLVESSEVNDYVPSRIPERQAAYERLDNAGLMTIGGSILFPAGETPGSGIGRKINLYGKLLVKFALLDNT